MGRPINSQSGNTAAKHSKKIKFPNKDSAHRHKQDCAAVQMCTQVVNLEFLCLFTWLTTPTCKPVMDINVSASVYMCPTPSCHFFSVMSSQTSTTSVDSSNLAAAWKCKYEALEAKHNDTYTQKKNKKGEVSVNGSHHLYLQLSAYSVSQSYRCQQAKP